VLPFHLTFLTLFPELVPGTLGCSLPGKALESGLWRCDTLDLRAFAADRHRTVDDTPYGGGAGMVMKPDVVGAAIEAAQARMPGARLVHLTPRGTPLTQKLADTLAREAGLLLLCGRFEGVDERVNRHYRPLEVSIGDFVLFGGEVAAMALAEAVLRRLPGLLGNPETAEEESFDMGEESALLLEYPHYTKPPLWKGMSVPDVLASGHHGRVRAWRREEAERITRERRPDLWNTYTEHQKERKGTRHEHAVKTESGTDRETE
jgi:tRNA (guanine37-N1)-methyltransferase